MGEWLHCTPSGWPHYYRPSTDGKLRVAHTRLLSPAVDEFPTQKLLSNMFWVISYICSWE